MTGGWSWIFISIFDQCGATDLIKFSAESKLTRIGCAFVRNPRTGDGYCASRIGHRRSWHLLFPRSWNCGVPKFIWNQCFVSNCRYHFAFWVYFPRALLNVSKGRTTSSIPFIIGMNDWQGCVTYRFHYKFLNADKDSIVNGGILIWAFQLLFKGKCQQVSFM